jgi:hypothetical protein
MFDLFDEVLMEVAAENGCTAWYEVFDSELMDEVENRIAARYGLSDEYFVWYNTLAEDL